MNDLAKRKKGILLVLLGIFILSPDSLLVRLIDIPFYTLMFWRGFFMFLSLALFLLMDERKHFVTLWLGTNKATLLISILFTASTFLFVSSLHYTSVAHTLLIVGTSPVFAAIFAFFILKEPPEKQVWFGIVIILAALSMVVQQEEQHTSLEGDFYALLSSLIMGYIFVYIRQRVEVHLVLALSLSGLWTALASLFLAAELSVTWVEGSMLFVLGTIVGLAFSLITLSARYLPAPVASMFMPLETVFGVFLVWIIIGEQPNLITITGGLIIIMALLLISYFELKAVNSNHS